MTIAILGAGGLAGQALVRACIKQKRKFCAAGHRDVDIADSRSLQAFLKKERPSAVVNCAAYTDVDGAEREIEKAFAVNAEAPQYLGQFAKEYRFSLLHLSTDYVFGGEKQSPYGEDDIPSPLGVYAKSKWEGERLLIAENPDACVLRISWLFGKGGRNFASMLLSLLQSRLSLKIVSDQIGRPTYAEDLAEVAIQLLGRSGVYHFANRGALSRYQMALDVKKEALAKGYSIACQEIVPVLSTEFSAEAPRPHCSILVTGKIERELGISPRTWEEVVKEYV